MGTKHSPLPWRKLGAIVYDADGKPVANAVTFNGVESKRMTANASRIVRAVNSHDDLLAACRKALDAMTWALEQKQPKPGTTDPCVMACQDLRSEFRAAIAKAEGQDGGA